MANLSVNEITRESKEYRSELLVEKIFLVRGKTNNFMTDNGLFYADEINIQGELYKYSPQYSNEAHTQMLASKILALKGQRNVTLELSGKMTGSDRKVTLPISKIEKSEEFGGQPAGGAKENKGLKFERDFTNAIAELLRGEDTDHPMKAHAKYIIDLTSKNMRSLQSVSNNLVAQMKVDHLVIVVVRL